MQLKSKASLDFIRDSVSAKTTFGSNVIGLINTNISLFPNLPVAPDALATANTSLTQSVVAAKTGDHVAVATLILQEKAWDNDFRQTANYVSAIANGNEAIIRSAGFVPTKNESQPARVPEQPQGFDVNVNKARGSFSAECKTVNGAEAYVYTATPDGVGISNSGNVLTITCGAVQIFVLVDTHRKVSFDNVPGGNLLNVAVYAVNVAGSGPATASQQIRPQ